MHGAELMFSIANVGEVLVTLRDEPDTLVNIQHYNQAKGEWEFRATIQGSRAMHISDLAPGPHVFRTSRSGIERPVLSDAIYTSLRTNWP